VNSEYTTYAQKVHRKLVANGIRSEINTDTTTINYKIRQAELHKIPYMIICGQKEAKARTVSVRKHTVGNIGSMTVPQLLKKIKQDSP